MRAMRLGEGCSLLALRAMFSRSRAAMRSACERWASWSALICAPKPMGMVSVVVTAAGGGGVGPDIVRDKIDSVCDGYKGAW